MAESLASRIKHAVRPVVYNTLHPGKRVYDCPVCGYRGRFKDKAVTYPTRPGRFLRLDSKCLNCSAKERHRFLHLVIAELFPAAQWGDKRVLHFAPEACLAPLIRERFGEYHTADLFMPGVQFKEDLQAMSFDNGRYDAVIISHVFTCVPKLEPSVIELRRVLAPGGVLVLAEAFVHEHTVEYGQARGEFYREIGLDLIEFCGQHFDEVELRTSQPLDGRHQLVNRMRCDGRVDDNYPEPVRVPGDGYYESTLVCRVA